MKPVIIFHDDPPIELLTIDQVWAFIICDETGDEGICAAPLFPRMMCPLIAADEARVNCLIGIARDIARVSGKTIKLVKFSQRDEVMEITP